MMTVAGVASPPPPMTYNGGANESDISETKRTTIGLEREREGLWERIGLGHSRERRNGEDGR